MSATDSSLPLAPMIPRTIYNAEHEAFRDTARRFFRTEVMPQYEKWEEQQHIDRNLWNRAGELGLLGATMPVEYGGSGVDRLYSAILIEEQAYAMDAASGFVLHSDIVTNYILNFGNEEQKQKWLPKMTSGECVGAIAMTEPGTGSDLQAIRTTAVDMGDHYLLNGSKIFITNGYLCDMAVVAAKTGNSEKNSANISLFIVDAHSEGFSKGKPLKKIGMKGQDTAELFFDNVKVPKENLLGMEGMGFMMLMKELAWERLLVGLIAQAAAEVTLAETIRYTKERKAFGKPIGAFQNTRFKLAEMRTKIDLGRVYADRCLQQQVEGTLSVEAAAAAKYWLSEMVNQVADECVQLHGGYGYMLEYPVARSWADNRAHRIYAGTNEIMKELIARSM